MNALQRKGEWQKIGRQEHRDAFCRHFDAFCRHCKETYAEYDPQTLPWPELDDKALKRLRAAPATARGRATWSPSRPPRNVAKANRVERLARSLLSIAAAIALSDCTDAPAQPYNELLARRCADLLAIFDKYGVQHSQGSGGPDIIYVGAGIDCRNGRYAQGIQAMEDLLQRNKIPYPPA